MSRETAFEVWPGPLRHKCQSCRRTKQSRLAEEMRVCLGPLHLPTLEVDLKKTLSAAACQLALQLAAENVLEV